MYHKKRLHDVTCMNSFTFSILHEFLYVFNTFLDTQNARHECFDNDLEEVSKSIEPVKDRLTKRFYKEAKEKQKLRGHLAKVYAMHWATDSR